MSRRVGFLARVARWVTDRAEDAVDAVVDAVSSEDEDAYLRLLWLMKSESGSPYDPNAGLLYSDELGVLTEYASVDELLTARPRLATYRYDDQEESAIFWAAFYGPLELVRRLEELGADPHATVTNGTIGLWMSPPTFIDRGGTPLMMAAAAGQDDIVRHFIERGVPATAVATDRSDGVGPTALHFAAEYAGTADTVGLLVEAGCAVDGPDAYGNTPLGLAARRGAGPVVEVLLEAGADPHGQSGSHSAMSLAGDAPDSSAMRAFVSVLHGRILTLDDVVAALSRAGIAHEVMTRGAAVESSTQRPAYAVVAGQVTDGSPEVDAGDAEYFVFAQDDDLEDSLERLGVGARRFATEGETKSVLGIAAGGVTPFASANDPAGIVAFYSLLGGSDGRVALEAFDADRVVVLDAGVVREAVGAFVSHVGRPPGRAG